MNIDQHRLCAELQRLDWARELSQDIVQEIAASAELMEFSAGHVVIELDSGVNHVYFVVAGRLAGALFDRLGKEIQRDIFGRGSAVGLFYALLPDRSHLHVEAGEATTAIRLPLDELLRLTAKHREFQLAMFRVAANVVKRLVMVDRELPKPAVVGIVHHSGASRPLTVQLARRLLELGESPCVAGDEQSAKAKDGIPYRTLYQNGTFIGSESVKHLLREWGSHGRLLVDFRADRPLDDLIRLVSYSDVVFWCVRPDDVLAAVHALKALQGSAPRLCAKICLVWILTTDTPAPPHTPDLCALIARDFKTYFGQAKPHQSKMLGQGVERIIHFLRGVQIGLALGGGAARGMAHLGVLKSLEEHGICVDMLAGTSAGAMVGIIYASGLDPAYSTRCFKEDLLPPWFFRVLPGGGYWYLLYKYRFHQFGPMLRKYLNHLHMGQLVIPVTTIGVDLVEGSPLARDTGDATDNILESINLPPLALPLVRAEQAVVDGGLLNNVPANVLVAKGCNFVIASTVTASLERDFMGIRSRRKPRGFNKFLSSVQVMMRQNMIQNHNMNAVGVEPADFVIAPNVTAFDISEFTRADEMAEVGESTISASISSLKGMLSKLDSKLFA